MLDLSPDFDLNNATSKRRFNMKFRKSFVFILMILAAMPAILIAADQVSFDTAAVLSKPSVQAEDTFRAVITSDDQLIVKPGKVFSEGDDAPFIQLPYLVSSPKGITYPRWARRQGLQGEMVIAVEILSSGKVGRQSAIQSTGYSILDEAAMEAMKTWQFHPAMKDGKPVLTCIQIPVRFQLNSKS